MLEELKVGAFKYAKDAWRYKLVEAPKYCSDDTPQEACTMVCGFDPADEDASAYAWNYLSVFLGDFVHGITNRTTQLEIVRRLICDTSFVLGEQAESASPLDPSFWPVHPTMDRLLQYKRLVSPFLNTHWMNTQAQPPHGTVFCVTDQCKGHHRDDVTTFITTVQGDDGVFERRYLTNGELFDFLNPLAPRMSYVYDNFRWEHCDAQGLAFPLPPQRVANGTKGVTNRTATQ